MIEQEIKVLLDEAEFVRLALLSKNCNGRQVIQTNHYFDTADFWFDRQGISIRIREKEGNYSLTFKVTDSQSSNIKIKTSREFNYPLDSQTLIKLLRDETSIDRSDFQFAPEIDIYQEQLARVKYLGKLVTERVKFRPAANLPEVELDRNCYLDTVDWELECELNSTAEMQQVEKWLTDIGIKLEKPAMSKNSRFIRCYKSLKKSYGVNS